MTILNALADELRQRGHPIILHESFILVQNICDLKLIDNYIILVSPDSVYKGCVYDLNEPASLPRLYTYLEQLAAIARLRDLVRITL